MSKSVNKLGFWAGILSAVFSVLWFITFKLQDVLAPVPVWYDVDTYAEAFSWLRLLYIYPSLLLALSFVVLMACIHQSTPEDKKIWSLIGLAFAIVYSAMASINYNIQAAAVMPSLAGGETTDIAMLLPDNPHSVFKALANSYAYMAVAMVAAGFAFAGSRLKSWVRRLFLAQTLTACGQIGWSMFGLNTGFFIVTSLVWVVGAPAAFVLLAIMFRRRDRLLALDQSLHVTVPTTTLLQSGQGATHA